MDRRRGGNEGVAQGEAVAGMVGPQVVSGAAADFGIDRNAGHLLESRFHQFLLPGPHSGPDFRQGYGRVEKYGLARGYGLPASGYGRVALPENLNEDVGVYQERLHRVIFSSRLSFRKART